MVQKLLFRSHFKIGTIILAALLVSCNPKPIEQSNQEEIKLKLIASGISGPVAMDCPKDNSGRLFICEQAGKIKIIKNGKVLDNPFLDITDRMIEVNNGYSEIGLLSITFHPEYKTNGRFFIYYSAKDSNTEYDHKSIVAEFKVSANSDIADPASEKIIMEVHEPESNHNGGQLAFGPDGFLYIGLGDGGGGGDEHGENGNGQDLRSLLGKMLRINVNPIDSIAPYTVPSKNPFVNHKNTKPEIWAYGLRNPWRFSFDKKEGSLFCADVGQNAWEEIDIIENGKNYGWRTMEGNHCYNPSSNCDQSGLTLPIAEYSHDVGICITGGFVYRGKNIPSLEGKYIFADWTGKMFFLKEVNQKWEMHNLNLENKNGNDLEENINSFGEDENGELYILTQKSIGAYGENGSVYRIDKKNK